MNPLQRVDPEIRPTLEQLQAAMPGGLNSIADLDQRRAIAYSMVAAMTKDHPALAHVLWEDRVISDADTGSGVAVRVYRPREKTPSGAGILFIHSGGMILGDLNFEHSTAASLCAELDAVVVSVDYRLAPENPYPAGLNDCMRAYEWVLESGDELGIETDRIAVYGASAGGGLAVALGLRIRDTALTRPQLIMSIYPMLDDRQETPSSQEITDIGVWDASHNAEGWAYYLSGQNADGYAAPSRASNLANMPPVFIEAAELDVFRDEDVQLGNRLMQAGVPTELHVYPGAFHGYDAIGSESELVRRVLATRFSALSRALT